MILRQLFDVSTSTYTYLIADPQTRHAALIDPVREQAERDIQLIEELGLTLVHTLETHIHADHVTASGVLRNRLGSRSVMSTHAGVGCADVTVSDGDTISVGNLKLIVRETPGHTAESICFVTEDQHTVFTGDTLFIRGCGRTDFQAGDARALYRSVHEKLFTLPDDCRVFPGHDYKGRTMSTIREEKAHNPRLGGGKTEDEFVQIMEGLNLPRPKFIDEAVPANQQCGFERPHVSRSANGVPEVSVDWVRSQIGQVRIIDVRGPDEYVGELGHVDPSELVVLDDVPQAAQSWDKRQPIVLVCRSGGRSGRAAKILEDLGFTNVQSMAGGMLAWNEALQPR